MNYPPPGEEPMGLGIDTTLADCRLACHKAMYPTGVPVSSLRYSGTIRAVFLTASGAVRYVVEGDKGRLTIAEEGQFWLQGEKK